MLASLTVAAALGAAAGAYAAARLRYGETQPFTGRTYVAFLSHREAREYAESDFAAFKEKHASLILGSSNPETVRIRNLTQRILRATRHGLILMAQHGNGHGGDNMHLADELDWMDRLDWEVIVVRHDDGTANSFPGAGKIVVPTGSLHFETHDGSFHRLKTDAEIAVPLAHEVGHVVARHTSRILGWLHPLLKLPILRLFLLPYLRRDELEADHIGILLLAAAGVDPHIAVQYYRWMEVNLEPDPTLEECLKSTHPSYKRRWQFLSHPKVMNEAMELYKQVASHVQG